MSEEKIHNGVTKWFDRKKGYGFITRDDGKDYFAHYSNIVMDGFKALEKGEPVTFKTKPDKKGELAVEITPVKK